MSMFSEISAGETAKKLGKVLLLADIEGGEVKKFAKAHLFDWYLNESAEAWGGHSLDAEIIKKYK